MTNPILTIAIPTYNRPNQILDRVRELLPCLTDETELLIIDNHSLLSVEDLVRSTFDRDLSHVRFVRNRFNIGSSGNVCRCFEEAAGEWMWTLGDDDLTDPEAISNILSEIHQNSEQNKISGFTYSTGIYDYPKNKLIDSFESVCDQLTDPRKLSNSIFISAQVYRLESIRNYIREAYLSMSSYAPHFVMMLRAIEDGLEWKYISVRLVHYSPADPSQKWDPEPISAGFALLPESAYNIDKISKVFQKSLIHHLCDISFKRAMRKIAFSDNRSLKFLEIYYLRIAPLMKGFGILKMIFLALFARLVSHSNSLQLIMAKLATALSSKNVVCNYDRERL